MKTIFENLEQQKDSYQKLLEHMSQQQQAIAEQDDEALMKAIKDKNAHVQKLHQLEQDMNTRLDAMTQNERDQAAQETETLREEIVRLIEQLVTGEEECQKTLTQQKDELEAQMAQFKKKKNLFKGYQDPSSSKGGGFRGNA